MTLETTKKLAQHIFRLLKVTEIVLPIGKTNKGDIGLKFTQNNDDYEIVLDSVPLSTKSVINDDNNIELKKMIEKYLFESEKKPFDPIAINLLSAKQQYTVTNTMPPIEKKKRGRPKGSTKNKPSQPEVNG